MVLCRQYMGYGIKCLCLFEIIMVVTVCDVWNNA